MKKIKIKALVYESTVKGDVVLYVFNSDKSAEEASKIYGFPLHPCKIVLSKKLAKKIGLK